MSDHVTFAHVFTIPEAIKVVQQTHDEVQGLEAEEIVERLNSLDLAELSRRAALLEHLLVGVGLYVRVYRQLLHDQGWSSIADCKEHVGHG